MVRKTNSDAGFQWLTGLIMGCAMLSARADVILEEFVEPKPNAIEAFDHLSTGFPLTGDHDLLECKQCHTAGFYEKLPTRCDACHDNAIAQGLPANHVKVKGPCDICHTTTGFIENLVMDHRFVEGACFSCHNGASLKGKSPDHAATSSLCEACHNTSQWTPVEKLDHSQTQAFCRVCHNGVKASGKPATHIASSEQCNNCHRSSNAWLPVTVDHDQVRGICSSCHTMPASHPKSSKNCANCHTGRYDWREGLSVNHDEIRDNCENCHFPPSTHGTALVLRRCADCHSFRSFNEVRLDHAKFREISCENCHNGMLAENKSQKHCLTALRCEVCHHTHGWSSDKRC